MSIATSITIILWAYSMLKVLTLSPRAVKFLLGLWPPMWFTGIRFEHISEDFKYIRVRMALRFYNKNLHGIQYGGSLYSMIDPCHLMMLIRNMGSGYRVLDSGAHIDFIKPGKSAVSAECTLSDADIADITANTANGEPYFKDFTITIVDNRQEIVAKVLKTVYIRKKLPSHRQ